MNREVEALMYCHEWLRECAYSDFKMCEEREPTEEELEEWTENLREKFGV